VSHGEFSGLPVKKQVRRQNRTTGALFPGEAILLPVSAEKLMPPVSIGG
jgi:hypothetical protein